MKQFIDGYIEALLFAETDDNDEPLDRNYTVEYFAPETLATIEAECNRFIELADGLITPAEYTEAGRDFYLTRQGHGCGFWDGDWSEHGDKLTAISEEFGQTWYYIGDDGKIYS